MTHQQIGELAAMATAVFWTLSALAWTSAGKHVGALAVSFLRLVLAVGLLMLFGYLLRGRAWPSDASPNTWWLLGWSGFLGFFVSDLSQFKAFLVIGPRLSLLIVSSLTPPVTVLMSLAYAKLWPSAVANEQTFGLHSWIGMAITIAGVLWVLLERRAEGEHTHTRAELKKGIGLSLFATVIQSAGMVMARQGAALYNDAAASALIRILGAVAGYLILITLLGRWPAMFRATQQRPAMLILCGGTIVGPCLGVTTLMIAMQQIHEGVTTTILATIPVLILPFSIYLYRERVGIRAFGGALVALAGVAVLMWPG